MTTLTVDMGGVHYTATTPDARTALDLVRKVHEALTGLGLEPWVHAPGLYRDQWGALRISESLARTVTRAGGQS